LKLGFTRPFSVGLFKDAQEAAEQSGFEQEIAKITKVKGRTQIGRRPAAAHARQLKGLGLYAEDLSRLVRRSLEVAFSIRTTAGRRRKGLSESSPVRSAGI